MNIVVFVNTTIGFSENLFSSFDRSLINLIGLSYE